MPQADDEYFYGTLTHSHLEDWANDAFSGLKKLVEHNVDARITDAFTNACEFVQDIKFGHTGASAFRLEGSTMLLNASHLVRVFELISADLAADDAGSGIHPDSYLLYTSFAVALFTLHELRHIDQNMASFEDVQILKSLDMAFVIAEFDLLADRDAVMAFALIFADAAAGGSYLEAFKIGLFFSKQYFFRSFSFDPKSKPHKALRAASMLLMLARFAVHESCAQNLKTPLDAALIIVATSPPAASSYQYHFVVLADLPSRHIFHISDLSWSDGLASLLVAIENEDTDRALIIATTLVEAKMLNH